MSTANWCWSKNLLPSLHNWGKESIELNRESTTTLVAQRKGIENDDNTVVKSLDDPKVKFAPESYPVKTSLKDGTSKPLSSNSYWRDKIALLQYRLNSLPQMTRDISNDLLSVTSDDLSSTDSSSSAPLCEGGAPDYIVPILHQWSIQSHGLVKGTIFDHPHCIPGTKISISPTAIYRTRDLRG